MAKSKHSARKKAEAANGVASSDAPKAAWEGQHLRLAVGMGLGFGLVGQIAIAWLMPGAMDSPWLARLVGVLCSTAMWAVLALALALLSGPGLIDNQRGRLASTLSACVLGWLVLLQLCGVVLRVVSGSFLTLGALTFSLGSGEHVLHALVGDYLSWILGAIIVWLGLTVAFGRYLSLATSRRSQRRAWPVSGFLVLILALGALLQFRGHSPFIRSVFVSGPLLALVGSLDEDFSLRPTSSRPEAIGAPLAPPGPPIVYGNLWQHAARAHRGSRPNVLLLMLESVSPSHLSYAGYDRKTPAIDRLAYGGLRMTRVWTTATHSNYAQMAVLSSLFPRRSNGLDTYRRLDYPRVLFHDVFHLLDYDTATISSQDENWQGMLRFQQTGTPTYYWYSADHRGPRIDTGTEKIVPDDVTTDVALDWLSRRGDKPWALYMNFQGTHFPYTVGKLARRPHQPEVPTWPTFTYLRYPESEKPIVINRYDNALAQVDDQIARIYRYLKEVGELDNTLWIVTSDHGELFFEKGLVTHGRTLYEAEARVPLLLHWPDGIEPEERTEPVSHLDIMPTVLQLLGLPAHPAFQGRSFASASAASGEEDRRAVFMNIQGLRFVDAIVCWPYKLILDRTGETQLLFDLARDPTESSNIIEQHPEITTRLADCLKRQLLAQLDYHSENAVDLRRQRYQPRLLRCPRFPKN